MSNYETESVRVSSLHGGVQASDGARKIGLSITPSPIKKSKRQAERGGARAAFAATQRKEEEEDRFYRKPTPKKPKGRERTEIESNNTATKDENTKSLDKKNSERESLVETPSPTIPSSRSAKSRDATQSTTIPFPLSAKKRSKAPPAGEKGSDRKGVYVKTKTSSNFSHNRKRRKLVYKAKSGPDRPIDGYALELISRVCNNAYCVAKADSSNDNKSPSVITSFPKTKLSHKDRMMAHPQPHRVLDRPTGYTQESEPFRERLMRLQFRLRFASATSMGMSPIEFARKLLRLWGGTLEQVYETKSTTTTSAATTSAKTNTDTNTDTSAMENSFDSEINSVKRVVSTSLEENNCSSLKRVKLSTESKQAFGSKIEDEFPASSDGWNAEIGSLRFKASIAEFKPTSIHPDAQIRESKTNRNGLLHEDLFNLNFDSHNVSSNNLRQHNVPTKLNTNVFGESNKRIERTKKLIQRKQRKNLKKARSMNVASSSFTIGPKTQAFDSDSAPPAIIERNDMASSINPSSSLSPTKRKTMKKNIRKLFDDTDQLILFKDMRLSHPDDEEHLNALHCFVRAELLEVYAIQSKKERSVVDKDQDKRIGENPDDEQCQNIVGIRCAWCGILPRKERGKGQTMSTFFPKSIGEIYRGVCTWQRIHFPVCEHMPEHFKTEYKIRKEKDITRGRKAHWIKSAFDLGLRNVDSDRNGLTYQPGTPFDLQKTIAFDCDPGGRSKKNRSGIRRRSSSEIQSKTKAPVTWDDNLTTAVSPFTGSEDNEFELFGKDFDQSLEKSAKVALTIDDEAIS